MPFQSKKTVVVPIDFSESTQAALEAAAECAADNASIHVINVVWTPDPAPPFGTWNAEELAMQRQNARNKIAELLEKNDMVGATVVVLEGDAGQRIVEYAEEVNADLVVVPSHGYSGFKRLLLGSTTERIVRHVSCPVYVLRRHDAK